MAAKHSSSTPHTPHLTTQLSAQVRDLLEALTVEEKVALLSGQDVWQSATIERLGVGALKVTDGPNGARGDSSTGATAVCLPAAIGLAAGFDHDLVLEAGELLGRETRRKGSHVLLAPTINIARHPLGGRNFESFGEDPLLTAQLAVAYVNGVQSEGAGACAKHFVANDVEYARMTVSSSVPEAVLREVYLAPFEAVVEAGVWTVMASYPMLNGIHCTEHEWLLTTVLRDEWGFDGLVMSDWGATHHRSRPVLAGLDLEMPGPALALGPHLLEAVAEGEVLESVLDERAGRVIDLVAKADRLGHTEPEPEQSLDLDEDRHLARRLAAESMVLLHNDGTLPIASASDGASPSICVIGPNAADAVIQGGGSAQVPAHHLITPLDGLVAASGAENVTFHQGCAAHRYLPLVASELWTDDGTVDLTQFDNAEFSGEPINHRAKNSIAAFVHGAPTPGVAAQRWTGRLTIADSGAHSFGVLAVGRSRVLVNGKLVADNWTAPRPGDAFFQMASAEVVGEIELEAGSVADVVVEWAYAEGHPLAGLRFGHLPPVNPDAMLEEAVVAAGSTDVAVVVVGLNNEWETEGHDRAEFALPGRQNELVQRVAEANPNTVVVINAGGPVELPWLAAGQGPATIVAWYPGQEFGHALADVLLGRAEPGGRLPITWPRALTDTPFELPIPEPGPPRRGAVLEYGEGLLVGHRSYDHRGIDPHFPFGHGLGYTTFELAPPGLGPSGGSTPTEIGAPIEVVVPVTNTGERAGKCVVQLYLGASRSGGGERSQAESDELTRPVRALAAFAAVRAEPGQTVEAVLTVPARAFARWDGKGGAWVEDDGRREVFVGLSSRDLASPVVIERT